MPRLVGAILFVAMLTSSFARIEPAPFDIIICGWFALSFLIAGFAYHPRIRLPTIGVAIFLVTTLVTLPGTRMSAFNIRFAAVTLYLGVLWFFLAQLILRFGARAKDIIVNGWAISAIVSTALCLLVYFLQAPGVEYISRQGRVFGLFKDPNVYSAYLVFPFIFCLSRYLRGRGTAKITWAISLLIISTGLLVTYSRAAWGASLFAVAAYGGIGMLSKSKRGSTAKGVVVFAIIMTIVGTVVLYLLQNEEIATMFSHRTKMQRYDSDRFYTQFEALRMSVENPLGLGPGVSEIAFSRAIHNLYIRALVENGVLGLLSIGLLLGTTLVVCTVTSIQRRMLDPRADSAIIAAALWAVTIQSVVIDTIHWRHFWILLALGWWLPVSATEDGKASTTTKATSR